MTIGNYDIYEDSIADGAYLVSPRLWAAVPTYRRRELYGGSFIEAIALAQKLNEEDDAAEVESYKEEGRAC